MVVEDASADARFSDNPLVTGEPRIRFYAGAPLKTPDGYQIGTVCVIAPHARGLSEDQLRSLQALAQLTIDELELRLIRRQHEGRSASALLAMCAICKKVRDENGVWHSVEAYLSARRGLHISHGLCDRCLEPYEYV